MKHVLSTILSIAIFIQAQAQFSIKGKISDNAGKPVAYAFVAVLQNDSAHKSVAQKITDSTGKFILAVPGKGSYILQSSGAGYILSKDTIIVNNNLDDINITLQTASRNLRDVSVTAKLPTIEKKIDRLVMNVDNNPLTAGKSTMETLQLAPGIVVYNNQIMLNGMPISRVMVNGKMLQLQGTDLANYLTSLSSDDIKSIEIMAHPPAEYDAAGSGGLINIILKKNAKSGLNGSAYANYVQGKYAGTNEGVQLNFKKGKIGLFANYSFDKGISFEYLTQYRNLLPDGVYTTSDSGKYHYQSNNIHTGITYDMSDRQYLAIDYTGNFELNNGGFYAISQIAYPHPDSNSLSTGSFPNGGNGRYNNAGLNYHLQTDTLGSTFTLLSDYTHNYSLGTNSVNSATTAGGTTTDTAYQNSTPATSKIFTADAKYLKKFDAVNSLSFGGKISATDIYNQAFFQYQSPYGGAWQNSSDQNYVYDYKENIIAGYINYQGKILKTTVQLGLRGENTDYTGKLYDTGYAENGRNYFGLFPSVFLKRNLDSAGNHSLSFNYSRRLNRPGFWQLSPRVTYIDNFTISAGNPFLQPEYDNSFELSYTFKNKYVLTANYTHASDVITRNTHPEANNPDILMLQPTNAGSMQKWMASLYLPINIAKWWTTQEYVEYNNTHLINPDYDIQKNILVINTNMQFTIAKDFTATLHAQWFNNYIFSNATIGSIWQADMGLQKKLFKQRLTLKASVDDIFNTNRVKNGMFYYNDFNMSFADRWQSQELTLGVAYNFDLGKAFKAHQLESSSADEKNRLK